MKQTPTESRPSSRAQLDELVSSLLSSGPPSATQSVGPEPETSISAVSTPALGFTPASGRSSRLSNIQPALSELSAAERTTTKSSEGSDRPSLTTTLVTADGTEG